MLEPSSNNQGADSNPSQTNHSYDDVHKDVRANMNQHESRAAMHGIGGAYKARLACLHRDDGGGGTAPTRDEKAQN